MRILWLSNKIISESDTGSTGTWIDATAYSIQQTGEVKLGNITLGSENKIEIRDVAGIQQWILPSKAKPGANGLPEERYVKEIIQAVHDFSPDLLHVWGVEAYWGLLTARKLICYPTLLEMQGFKTAIANVYSGGLNVFEQLRCIGLKEILLRRTIYKQRKDFERWGYFEREIIKNHKYITVQTEWIKAHIIHLNPNCTIFQNSRILREPFYKASPWKPENKENEIKIFCSSAYVAPFKGLHVAIRALSILKKNFPNIQLRIAGALRRGGLREDGYIRWLISEVERLSLNENVVWLGALSADKIVGELQNCDAMLLPSFIENESNTLREAMYLGVPVVSSYAGGLTSLAKDEESALFFSPGDYVMCAHQLKRLLLNKALAQELSRNARIICLERQDRNRIIKKQLEIYRYVIDNFISSG
ncbi:MAG: glycosyltransferase family 4 protein [Candidatus Aminicenantes bacterium]|nr:glycosyltransferase family 4 protein [Candidatus Aminicenantes bacterium]